MLPTQQSAVKWLRQGKLLANIRTTCFPQLLQVCGVSGATETQGLGQHVQSQELADPEENTSQTQLSPMMKEVYSSLSDLGLQPGVGCIVGDGLETVDLAVFVQGKQIAIDVQPDATATAQTSSPHTYALQRVRQHLLKAHGWTLLPIPESEWVKMATGSSQSVPAEQEEHSSSQPSSTSHHQQQHTARHHRMHYLLQKLKEAVGTGQSGGHHHHHHEGCGCSH